MRRRQITPQQWLIVTSGGDGVVEAARMLPRGSGILLIEALDPKVLRRLRSVAGTRALTMVLETDRTARRVHGLRELTRALLRRTPMILLSPVHRTRSHPDWDPLPTMRAASLARLAGRRAIALGGMNRKRHAAVAALGFVGWAGISAFRT